MIFPSPCMHAKSLQLRLTLCDSTDYSPGDQAPLSMGFSRQENWSEFLCPPPGDLSDPGIEPKSLRSDLQWQAGSLSLVTPGKPPSHHHFTPKNKPLPVLPISKTVVPSTQIPSNKKPRSHFQYLAFSCAP